METILDESKVPVYTLPDLLIAEDGSVIHEDDTWWRIRRVEILNLFRSHVYGYLPEGKVLLDSELLSKNN